MHTCHTIVRKLAVFILIAVGLLLHLPAAATAQEAAGEQFADAIEDNSFFIEEAYNQEFRVVQHISNGLYHSKPSRSFDYSFTQEWPAIGQDHQLSFTLPYTAASAGNPSGIGDVMLNYRYQALGKEDGIAFSPRLSLIFPTGSPDEGTGYGVFGMQLNLPASKRLSNDFVLHVNAGMTLLPDAEGMAAAGKVKQTLTSYHTGASLIWLATSQLNFMLESVQIFSADIAPSGGVERFTEHILSPGIRYAIDVNDLQIVPGLAVPFEFTSGESRTGAFFYLSFEHPF